MFVSTFSQLYSIRIANLISMLTLLQTGKRYYQTKMALERIGNTEEQNEEGDQALQMLMTMN